MGGWHWLTLIIVAVAFYVIGSKYPGMVSKVSGGAVSA